MARKVKKSKTQIKKDLLSLSKSDFAEEFAYYYSAVEEKVLWRIDDKKTYDAYVEEFAADLSKETILLDDFYKMLEVNGKLKKTGKKLKGASYFANYRKEVNGHVITWNKNEYHYDIADKSGKVIGWRQTEPDAIKFANNPTSLNRPSNTKKTMNSIRKTTARNSSSTTKKKTAKRTSARRLCRTVIKVPGISARTGKLLKGWRYENGVPVKVTAKKKPGKKKGLGRVPVCQRRNPDNSTTIYSQQGGSTPCPYGGRLTGSAMVFANKAKAQAYASEKNKTSRVYRYTVSLFPISKGGDGKKHQVRKTKK